MESKLVFMFEIQEALVNIYMLEDMWKTNVLLQMEEFEEDNKLVRETLTMRAQSQAISGQKDYYDLLHLSPIKVRQVVFISWNVKYLKPY